MCNSDLSGIFPAGILIRNNLNVFISPGFKVPEILNVLMSNEPILELLTLPMFESVYIVELVPLNEQLPIPLTSENLDVGHNKIEILPPNAVTFGSHE